MNTNETQRMRPDEAGFLATLAAVELLVLPMLGGYLGKYGGGVAMLVTAVIVIAYLLLFGERLRSRGQTKPFVTVLAVSCAFSAFLALAYWVIRSHWQ